MKPGDRLVCAFVRSSPPGGTFTDWPLHVTIVPWFRTDIPSKQLVVELEQRLGDVAAFEAEAGDETAFGRGGRKLVNLIKLPSAFTGIEHKTRTLLHEYGAWIVDETTKVQRLFRPHVTVQKAGRLREGDTFLCNELYIVEQKGEYKMAAGRIHL